jgi:hypothetical protein
VLEDKAAVASRGGGPSIGASSISADEGHRHAGGGVRIRGEHATGHAGADIAGISGRLLHEKRGCEKSDYRA